MMTKKEQRKKIVTENVRLVFGIFVFGIGVFDILYQSFRLWYVFGLSLSLVNHLCLCKLHLCVFEKY